ncbi:WXG100 family type VII secretion target [Actinospica durhamensis]|uniref:ESAT-6-like protein n=1 Tax=Actinospica durhamensis TaxID=1508375 RepID=A0A941EWD3_9ACTN|nr:WXG100 family type VII secretion target [Actinospica durhamensis]MBR7839387.1 WXG100 family type VII secretion target [Actinospica durhamensis]
MASGTVHVAFGDMEDAAASVGAANRAVQSELDDLYRMLAPIIANWTGEASASFQYQHRVWTQAAEDLNSVLSHIVALLEDSHSAYRQAEADAASLWSE